MLHVKILVGIGGSAIGGILTAIVFTENALVVFVAMLVSAVAGGLLPTVGSYAGAGALIGMAGTVIAGLNHGSWPLFTLSGAVVGCLHQIAAGYASHAPAHGAPVGVRGNGGVREHEGQDRGKGADDHGMLSMATGSLVLAPTIGAIVGFLIRGPLGVTSFFFWGCVGVGASVGAALFLGLLTGLLWRRVSVIRREEGPDGDQHGVKS